LYCRKNKSKTTKLRVQVCQKRSIVNAEKSSSISDEIRILLKEIYKIKLNELKEYLIEYKK